MAAPSMSSASSRVIISISILGNYLMLQHHHVWQWHYYFLTNEGIDYLREFLHLPRWRRLLQPNRDKMYYSASRVYV